MSTNNKLPEMRLPHQYKINYSSLYHLGLDNYSIPFRDAFDVLHTQNSLELGLFKSGSGIYKVEEEKYEIQKGDIFILNNIEKHGIYSVYPPEQMVYMVISFEPSFVYFSENNIFDLRFLKIFFERSSTFQNRLPRENPYNNEISRLMLDIEREFIEAREGFELIIKVKLLNILCMLIRFYGYIGTEDSAYLYQKSNIDSLRKILSYIGENFQENITLESLSKIVHMNPSYLSSLFAKFNGFSLRSYICKIRVNRAKEYLRSTNKSILEISELCGFHNTSNFNRIFKKATGNSPSEYIRKRNDL